MNNKLIAISVTSAFIVATGFLYAAGDPVTHTFQPDTIIKSSEVNANFQDLADRIANNVKTTYDYKDYERPDSVTKKTFTVSNNQGNPQPGYDTETRVFTSTVIGDTETLVIKRKRYTGDETGTLVHHQDLKFSKTSSSSIFTGRDVRKTSDGTIKRVDTLTPGLTVRTNMMAVGVTWADGFTYNGDDQTSTNADITSYGLQTILLTGTDTLTVLDVADVPCLKFHVNRQSENFGTYQQIAWRCQGYGTAKVIEVRSDHSYVRVLSAME